MLFSRDIGIDLGTSNTILCDKKGRVIIREPSVVAVDVKSKRVVATGDQAKAMIGRTPGSIVAVRPLQSEDTWDTGMHDPLQQKWLLGGRFSINPCSR